MAFAVPGGIFRQVKKGRIGRHREKGEMRFWGLFARFSWGIIVFFEVIQEYFSDKVT